MDPSDAGQREYVEHFVDFLLDVGFAREIRITVTPADPRQDTTEDYVLTVTREACPVEENFFDQTRNRCMNNCPLGFYQNPRISRCSLCNTNCKVCSDLSSCDLCLDDTTEIAYSLQTDGTCLASINHNSRQHRQWFQAIAVSGCLLLFLGCCGLCALCGSGKSDIPLESESDVEMDDIRAALGGHARDFSMPGLDPPVAEKPNE
jgi:hypothetical protein